MGESAGRTREISQLRRMGRPIKTRYMWPTTVDMQRNTAYWMESSFDIKAVEPLGGVERA